MAASIETKARETGNLSTEVGTGGRRGIESGSEVGENDVQFCNSGGMMTGMVKLMICVEMCGSSV